MGFLIDWLLKLRLYFLFLFVRAVEIKPFLQIDPHAYCPCCGHRDPKSHIAAASDGEIVNCRHFCATCGWAWDEQTVTVIDPKTIVVMPQDVEEDNEEQTELQMRTGRRFVRIPPVGEEGVKVNGQAIPDRIATKPKLGTKIPVGPVV